MKGRLIVFEGIDGAGKTTVCRKAAEALEARGLEVEVTAEPTHEGIGAFIRSGDARNISQRTEALLFVADRNDHTEKMCRSRDAGKVVLCDRYFASTVAYQSAKLDGDSTDRGWLLEINRAFAGVPDAVILLDMDPGRSLDRVSSRGEAESKFENLGFLEQVRAEYLRLAGDYGFCKVDASAGPDEVLAEVMRIIDEVV